MGAVVGQFLACLAILRDSSLEIGDKQGPSTGLLQAGGRQQTSCKVLLVLVVRCCQLRSGWEGVLLTGRQL